MTATNALTLRGRESRTGILPSGPSRSLTVHCLSQPCDIHIHGTQGLRDHHTGLPQARDHVQGRHHHRQQPRWAPHVHRPDGRRAERPRFRPHSRIGVPRIRFRDPCGVRHGQRVHPRSQEGQAPQGDHIRGVRPRVRHGHPGDAQGRRQAGGQGRHRGRPHRHRRDHRGHGEDDRAPRREGREDLLRHGARRPRRTRQAERIRRRLPDKIRGEPR